MDISDSLGHHRLAQSLRFVELFPSTSKTDKMGKSKLFDVEPRPGEAVFVPVKRVHSA